jgi:hypothetical protein
MPSSHQVVHPLKLDVMFLRPSAPSMANSERRKTTRPSRLHHPGLHIGRHIHPIREHFQFLLLLLSRKLLRQIPPQSLQHPTGPSPGPRPGRFMAPNTIPIYHALASIYASRLGRNIANRKPLPLSRNISSLLKVLVDLQSIDFAQGEELVV